VKGRSNRGKILSSIDLEQEGSVEAERMDLWAVVHSHKVPQRREELRSCCNHMQRVVVPVVVQAEMLSSSHC
jgi:hypothetical protein